MRRVKPYYRVLTDERPRIKVPEFCESLSEAVGLAARAAGSGKCRNARVVGVTAKDDALNATFACPLRSLFVWPEVE